MAKRLTPAPGVTDRRFGQFKKSNNAAFRTDFSSGDKVMMLSPKNSLHTLALIFLSLGVALLSSHPLLAQYAISTIAGGGPNNLAELKASIGYPGSLARDSAGNT